MKLKSEKITVRDILELKKNSLLIVNREYQRAAVWNDAQQKKLIDSVLRGYPLPLFYLHHKKRVVAGMTSEGLEIIDGQQRINALYRFGENGMKLFDPVKDDKAARFPIFIRDAPCPWAHCDFLGLPPEYREKFLNTEIFIVKIETEIEDEARDLFIRLQAGLPLNAQEKRDAWPGGFTELVLKLGGKPEIERHPGHDFFTRHVSKNSKDRGEIRQLCAQICMIFFERHEHGSWPDIGTQKIDDYYYRNLGFDIGSPLVLRLVKTLDKVCELFEDHTSPKFKGHEAIHVVLLIDSLIHEYAPSWEGKFCHAYDSFKERLAQDKKKRDGDYWFKYGALTQTQSAEGRTIQRRHAFFADHMMKAIKPRLKDETRVFGREDREIVYYRDQKRCAVCKKEIPWDDLDIHHVEEHQHGGETTIENAVPVHRACHPKGQKAVEEFREQWLQLNQLSEGDRLLRELDDL
jgi:hypothetical protein